MELALEFSAGESGPICVFGTDLTRRPAGCFEQTSPLARILLNYTNKTNQKRMTGSFSQQPAHTQRGFRCDESADDDGGGYA